MLKVILYTQKEGAEFSAFHIWKQEPLTREELESLRGDFTWDESFDCYMVALRGIPVHAIFFIYQDLSMRRWDCINGFTEPSSTWNLESIQCLLHQCGIE